MDTPAETRHVHPAMRLFVWAIVVAVAYVPGFVALAMIIWADE